jgi:uncharacterized protein YdhG (YjbR/CyaY superfamily)
MKNFNPDNSSFMKGFTESYLADLGRVVAAWSHVEQQFLMLFLSVVVMKSPKGSMSNPNVQKLMGLSFDRQLKAFRDRLKELDIAEKSAEAVKRILDRLPTLRKQRDEVAHSAFSLSIIQLSPDQIVISQDESTTLFKSWKSQKPAEFKQVKQSHLKELFEKIHLLYWNLVELSLDPELRSHRERKL